MANRRSRPASTYNHDGNLILADTDQQVFHEQHLCLVNRYNMTPTDTYNSGLAQNLINKFYRKRQAHGTVYMVKDRFMLEKAKASRTEPFRNELLYREVVDMHLGQQRPEYFALGVLTRAGKRYYEIYKCKTPQSAKDFERYIKKARSDPEFYLRNVPVVQTKKFVRDMSRPRSLSVLNFQTDYDEPVEPVRPVSRPVSVQAPAIMVQMNAAAPPPAPAPLIVSPPRVLMATPPPILPSPVYPSPVYVAPVHYSPPPMPPPRPVEGGVTRLDLDQNEGWFEEPEGFRYIYSSNKINDTLDLQHTSQHHVTYVPIHSWNGSTNGTHYNDTRMSTYPGSYNSTYY